MRCRICCGPYLYGFISECSKGMASMCCRSASVSWRFGALWQCCIQVSEDPWARHLPWVPLPQQDPSPHHHYLQLLPLLFLRISFAMYLLMSKQSVASNVAPPHRCSCLRKLKHYHFSFTEQRRWVSYRVVVWLPNISVGIFRPNYDGAKLI